MENINELALALSIAQGQMESAKKDTTNPFFKSKYADLASVISAIKEPLSKNGLAYTQLLTTFEEDKIFLRTVLMHKSGQFIESSIKVKPSKDDMQGLGSAITYARRYALQSIIGISADDDDAESAVGRTIIEKVYNVKKPEVGMPTAKVVEPVTQTVPFRIITAQEGKHLLGVIEKSGYTKDDLKKYAENMGYKKASEFNEEDYEDSVAYFSVAKAQRKVEDSTDEMYEKAKAEWEGKNS